MAISGKIAYRTNEDSIMLRLLLVPAVLTGVWLCEARAGQSHQSPYAGEQTREIKSLRQEDIEELRRGGGWGLAKAAELNGYPGPLHLIELQRGLRLSKPQISAISAIYQDMKRQAVMLGEALIRHEQALETSFRHRAVDEPALSEALDRIEATRRALRFVHLAAHLKTLPLLTPEQIAAYSALRGYVAAGECPEPPAGHDPDRWRKHHCR